LVVLTVSITVDLSKIPYDCSSSLYTNVLFIYNQANEGLMTHVPKVLSEPVNQRITYNAIAKINRLMFTSLIKQMMERSINEMNILIWTVFLWQWSFLKGKKEKHLTCSKTAVINNNDIVTILTSIWRSVIGLFWQLRCMLFFDLRVLITLLVFLNYFYGLLYFKEYQVINNDLQNFTPKTKDWATRTPLQTGLNSCDPQG
jgi:hypothetical protein